jgi:hypothetical protein
VIPNIAERHKSQAFAMRKLVHVLPRLVRRGYKMLPSKDSDANDVIHEQQPASIDEDRQEEPRISARTSSKDPRSYLDRRT